MVLFGRHVRACWICCHVHLWKLWLQSSKARVGTTVPQLFHPVEQQGCVPIMSGPAGSVVVYTFGS